MREQANLAIAMADVILFLTDIKQGVTAADREISIMLKKSGKTRTAKKPMLQRGRKSPLESTVL